VQWEAFRAGDEATWHALVTDCSPRLLRMATVLLHDPVHAEDAVQETLVAAWRARLDFRGDAELDTWIIAILIRVCRRLGRGDRTWLRKIERWSGALVHPSHDEEVSLLTYGPLYDAIGRLVQRQREVVALYYFLDYSVADIAVLLVRAEGTIKSDLARARRKLRGVLSDEFEPSKPRSEETFS